MTVEQASAQETPARPTPELPEKGMPVEKEKEEEEDLPLAQERKHDGKLLDIKEVKEKAAEQLPDRPASDYSTKVTGAQI